MPIGVRGKGRLGGNKFRQGVKRVHGGWEARRVGSEERADRVGIKGR